MTSKPNRAFKSHTYSLNQVYFRTFVIAIPSTSAEKYNADFSPDENRKQAKVASRAKHPPSPPENDYFSLPKSFSTSAKKACVFLSLANWSSLHKSRSCWSAALAGTDSKRSFLNFLQLFCVLPKACIGNLKAKLAYRLFKHIVGLELIYHLVAERKFCV